jgi:hypothetical protein
LPPRCGQEVGRGARNGVEGPLLIGVSLRGQIAVAYILSLQTTAICFVASSLLM